MPPCNFTIQGPTSLNKGQSASYEAIPPLQHPCTTKIRINGKPALVGTEIDGLQITQLSLGMVSVRATKDDPNVRITIEVDCRDAVPPCGPTEKFLDVGDSPAGFDWLEIPKTIGLPISLPLCGLCKLLDWLRKILWARPNPWLCIFCDWLPDWWKGLF